MNNFNHVQQQHLQLQNGNSMPLQMSTPGTGYMQNAGTPPPGFQNTGTYAPSQQQQHQMGNPRPTGGVPMQNMGYGQMGMQQQQVYVQHQQNSPAPATVTGQGQGNDFAANISAQPASAQQQQSQAQAPSNQPQKEFNVASFCRLGQETIQELVNKTNEMFGCLKATQPPDGKYPQGVDRKQKLHEMLRAVKALVKRLRIIYEKMEEGFPSSETMEIDVQSLIPYQDEDGDEETAEKENDRKNSEAYMNAVAEYQEVAEQVTQKNRHLKETIDHLRQICWDVNHMLAMRKD